jgi:hypothetical protein
MLIRTEDRHRSDQPSTHFAVVRLDFGRRQRAAQPGLGADLREKFGFGEASLATAVVGAVVGKAGEWLLARRYLGEPSSGEGDGAVADAPAKSVEKAVEKAVERQSLRTRGCPAGISPVSRRTRAPP